MRKMSGKKVHFIGVGGVGMAGLALLLKSRGDTVTGCDVHPSARTRWLESNGIPVAIGHDPSHLVGALDEVVVTPAVRRDEPELLALAARNAALPPARQVALRFRGEVLAELANARDTIAVCGSHGKTTTATWVAKLLLALGESVAWCIGGETGDFPVAGVGSGPLVVEADESDGTLALYHAKILVVNKLDYDHPDHFKTEADYFACYETAKRQAGGVIESESLSWKLFDCSDCSIVRLKTCLLGLAAHNRKNARAAVEVALRRGHSLEAIARVLSPIVSTLPDRRFQTIWPLPAQSPDLPISQSNNLPIEQSNNSPSPLVITDYAHHPAEMTCAVGMARSICRGRLRVLFQPHRYSRTKALLKDFPPAFEGVDEIVLCPTYAAFERPVEGGGVADLYAAVRAWLVDQGKKAALYLARSCAEAWEHARNSMADGDLTLLLGAGDIIGLVPQVQGDLGATCGPDRPMRRIWIGAGTNTWKSDLNLDVEYVRTSGPADAPGASLGIPWMAGIPGTVGGWVKMNAGAFGHSISEVLEAVNVDGEWRPASACGFAYRHSDIVGEIRDVRLKPPAESPGEPTAADYLARRRRFPAGTFGSFFKNPPGDSAGRLLEAAGAKGLRVGGAYVWSEHANVIVRGEGATPSDVLALAQLMRNRVLFRFGVTLEPEVRGIDSVT